MESRESKPVMINQTALLERGWTKSMAEKLLPEPMRNKHSSYYRKTLVKQWRLDDVVKAEATEEFKVLQAKAEKRRATGKAVAERKRENTMEQVQRIIEQLDVTVLHRKKLKDETIAAKNAWNLEHGDIDPIRVNELPREVLVRWEVNFIRHNLTDYEKVLHELSGLVGKSEASVIIRNAILEKIGEAYPYLKNECIRQSYDPDTSEPK